jgi:single-strand DNA-binding protein
MQKNRIEVAGFLASQPTRRYLPSGTPVANVRMGESHAFMDSEGKTQTQTNWHNLSFYGELADAAVRYEKGDNLFVEGTIEHRQFTPKDGSTRTVNEIIVRSAHLIAPPRSANGQTSEAALPETRQEEKERSDEWPI